MSKVLQEGIKLEYLNMRAKLKPRERFDTQLAWSMYQVHRNYVKTAKELSEYLGITITSNAVSQRFRREGLMKALPLGGQTKPNAMNAGVRCRRFRERKAQKEKDLVATELGVDLARLSPGAR